MNQVHDISPANGENIDDPDPVFHLPGLFWLVRLDEGDWEQLDDNTWRLDIDHLKETDRFQLLGPGNVKTHLSMETIYQRVPGEPVAITPQTSDPLSPNNWAGKVWQALATTHFSASYDDGSFSVQGTAQWAPTLTLEGTTTGHIIHERNGVFAQHAEEHEPLER